MLLFAGREVNLADLGNTFDNVRHLLAEFFADINDGDGGVFDGIVQQAGSDRDRVHFHFRKHERNLERMHEVRLARSALLPGMLLLRKLISLAN